MQLGMVRMQLDMVQMQFNGSKIYYFMHGKLNLTVLLCNCWLYDFAIGG
jgi:hypothetical protein